jgi:hypothetical protein
VVIIGGPVSSLTGLYLSEFPAASRCGFLGVTGGVQAGLQAGAQSVLLPRAAGRGMVSYSRRNSE